MQNYLPQSQRKGLAGAVATHSEMAVFWQIATEYLYKALQQGKCRDHIGKLGKMALSPSHTLAFVKDLHICPLLIASMYQEE